VNDGTVLTDGVIEFSLERGFVRRSGTADGDNVSLNSN